MNEEYEIIFIPDEGRAILNKKTKKVYYSEFKIIEEKNDEIKDLQTRWDSLREDIQRKKDILDKDQAFRFNHETEFKLSILNYVLDKMNELEEKDKE